jgi:Tat protein secretion system quality control protein TatD with DNase activity
MNRFLICAVCSAPFLLPAASHAQRPISLHARTAEDLAQLCAANPRTPIGDAQVNFCHGFTQGVADTMMGLLEKPFCFPQPTPTRTATLAQFVDWVKAVPDHTKLPAARGFATFLRERFPCK